MISIVIADDHAVVRTGIQLILADSDIKVLAEADNGDALLMLLKQQNFDVAILDVNMPGISSTELLLKIRNCYPSLPIVIFTMNTDEQLAAGMFKHGIKAYINKEENPVELVKAVKHAAAHKRYLTRQQEYFFANQLISGEEIKQEHDKLTERELQIMYLLASGKSKTDISDTLSISKNTISNHRNNILKKLHLSNNVELTKYAISHNLIN